MKKKLVFIVNPIAGKGNGNFLSDILLKYIDGDVYDYSLVMTEYAGHAGEIAAKAAEDGVNVVVAVGGDGTVNEIASSLSGTKTALAIIPRGSGNGLAYHLDIPGVNIKEAVAIINRGKVIRIDTASLNGHPFFCTCGVGYDAKVAMDYANAGTRGLATYVRKTIEAWYNYTPQTYRITTESTELEVKAFLITCGNANQWGNHYHITPKASLQDGMLDLTIIHPFNLIQAIPIPVQLLDSHIYHHSKVDSIRAKQVRIERICAVEETSNIEAHYDGEAFWCDPVMEISCTPSNLDVIVP